MFRYLRTCFLTKTCLRQIVQLELNVRPNKFPSAVNHGLLLHVRTKYVKSGIQGRRSSKAAPRKYDDDDENEFEEDDNTNPEDKISLKDSEYEAIVNEAFGSRRNIQSEENVFVIQPYIKWGPKKSNISPDIKHQESEDLINSLDNWTIQESIKVPLLGYEKQTFFGTGKINELKRQIKMYNVDIRRKISVVFVSVSRLNQIQKNFLETVFGVPVMDRFSIVIQILKAHATSREAKLQIALAELPYIWHHMGTENSALLRSQLTDSQKQILRNRERRIKTELEHIRVHRKMARTRRSNKEIPVIAVVGYTNAGKTSLIKALTNGEKLEPKNKLFATLDVTAHPGRLPCNLQVIFIDTIGFMSDIPTDLIECFITTLEDAMMADLIIHVQDMAHLNVEDQKQHVKKTLEKLVYTSECKKSELLDNVINVGNKCDLIDDLSKRIESLDGVSEPIHLVSCAKNSGMKELMQDIEKNILKITNRRKMIIKVPQGSQEMSWLYKNTAVVKTEICSENNEYLNVHVLLTELNLIQFKKIFLKKTK